MTNKPKRNDHTAYAQSGHAAAGAALAPSPAPAPAPAPALAAAHAEAIRMGRPSHDHEPLCGALSAWPLERVKGAL